eukprot:Filipodium_phascolosomae@DN1457_c0_g1_i1.p1
MTKVGHKRQKVAKAGKKVRFTVQCKIPCDDHIIDAGGLETFFRERIKVANKTGNLGTKVALQRERTDIHVTVELPFQKRYIKYLTKKYLQMHKLRDFLRVIANNKNSYEIRYFNIPSADGN